MTVDVAGCHAVLHIDRLTSNLAMARSMLDSGARILGVVKANAYGHGALAVSRALERAGIDGFAVDSPDEGIELRQAGIASPILVMNPLCPGDAPPMVGFDLTATVSDVEAAEALQAAARRAGRPADIHVRARSDCAGLGAEGDALVPLLRALRRLANLRVEGLFTHMIGPYRDDPAQIGREVASFHNLIDRLPADLPRPPLIHAVTSPGLFNAPAARFDMVRLGAVLYGIRMVEAGGAPFPFRPVMELVSRVAHLCRLEPGDDIGYGPAARQRRDGRSGGPTGAGGRAAMIPVGYADLPYLLRFRDSAVLIRGQRAPLIGEAFMGKVLADVTDIPEAALGDEAVFVGAQGIETITVEDIGKANGIRPSAILMLGPRVARRLAGQVGGVE